jgi:hypothetical protein
VTKNATAKMAAAIEKLEAVSRYLVAALQAAKILRTNEDGTSGFVDPTMFDGLDILKRGLVGRLRWLLLGK